MILEIDRKLYLLTIWTDDPVRMAAAHVPAGINFATKPALALTMIERALAAGVPLAWVAADSVYGVGDIEMAPPCFSRHARLRYDVRDPPSRQYDAEQANDTPELCGPPLIRWSIQEIRRIANRLAQR